MGLRIIEGDITTVEVDAIVNAANSSLLGGGGVDGAIHRAAGPKLKKECEMLKGCKTGEAKITKGYNLKARYVIHTVGPMWQGGSQHEEENLRSCYKNALALALSYNLKSIAFPLLSSGIYGYPKDQAMTVARTEIKEFLKTNNLAVTLVIFNQRDAILPSSHKKNLKIFIEENQRLDHELFRDDNLEALRIDDEMMVYQEFNLDVREYTQKSITLKRSLEDVVEQLDETFSEQMLRIIKEREKREVDVYKKGNIDRKLFSKMKNNKEYSPSKPTALALAIGLELNLDDMKDLLAKAGYALSPSSKADLIITYFIQEEIYDIFEINEALFAFSEPLLGV